MNKNELKKVLKPLIKECIKEVLFDEDGALSHIIKEVAVGMSGKQQITETKFQPPKQKFKKSGDHLKQKRKQLLDAIGRDAYNGVDVFKNTSPAPAAITEGSARGPLSDIAPNDPGVDISNLFGAKAFAMSQKMMEKK